MPNTDALIRLEAELAEFWKTALIRMTAQHPAYGSWQHGRRNSPPSQKAAREFEERKKEIFRNYFESREPQFLRLLNKIARQNDGRLTEAASAIWRSCRANAGDFKTDESGRAHSRVPRRRVDHFT